MYLQSSEFRNFRKMEFNTVEKEEKSEFPKNHGKIKKRTRRGKKKSMKHEYRNLITEVKFDDEISMLNDLDMINTQWNGTNNSIIRERRSKSRNSRQIRCLRPRHSPKAPHNSNQFLMDDQSRYSNTYLKFDSPDPFGERMSYDCVMDTTPELYLNDRDHSENISFYGDESDTKKFMEKDFEEEYQQVKFEALLYMSKSDLSERLLELEKLTESLEKELEISSSHIAKNSQDLKATVECVSISDKMCKEIEDLKKENAHLQHLLNLRN